MKLRRCICGLLAFCIGLLWFSLPSLRSGANNRIDFRRLRQHMTETEVEAIFGRRADLSGMSLPGKNWKKSEGWMRIDSSFCYGRSKTWFPRPPVGKIWLGSCHAVLVLFDCDGRILSCQLFQKESWWSDFLVWVDTAFGLEEPSTAFTNVTQCIGALPVTP
ncbi:MAG: hypothetical protein HY040_05905 [Planctomycetes bacterium]|nr:hypothetical protein [Planctomycetota bacterium]